MLIVSSLLKYIPWKLIQNIDKTLIVGRLLVTSYEILVSSAQFSVALVTNLSQFQTL